MVDLKELEKLETKQEKIDFLRSIILDGKKSEKIKEEAVKILNDLLKQEQSLEKKIEFSKIKQEDIIKEPEITQPTLEPKKEYKEPEVISKDHVYARNKNVVLKNLRTVLDRRGLLKTPQQNELEIKQEIYDYFEGKISMNRVDKYVNLLSNDQIEYQIFGNEIKGFDVENFLKVGGEQKKYYKIENEFS